ncbi:DNA translocase FtsK [Alicyclobacillus cellulosilyticus]|uniref:DNA translocase FtsK n=1 Tax=Alicyclobacillus cellulosilyticus TaxID=1003997 RepID=A0A917KBP9_9BACL|nr:DNA translocase FtsK [Alicyclobacillus cellulosilyticus]GGJ04608.1 DNA translocase FtsK [Alicyclobacillus cellulosilyticus]
MGKKQHRQDVLRYELTGLGLLTLSALALGKLGLVGRYLDVAFVYLAGSWSFLVPIFIGYAAVYMMVQRATFPWHSRHMGLLVLFVTWLTAMEFDLYQRIAPLYAGQPVPLYTATLNAIKNMCEPLFHPADVSAEPSGAGGGLIGYVFFAVAHALFSTVGTMLVLAVGALIGAALVTQQSLVAGVQRGTRWVERQLEKAWSACRQYIAVLFSAERATARTKSRAGRQRPGPSRRQVAEVVLEGEVVAEEDQDVAADAAQPMAQDQPPVVRDFAEFARPPRLDPEGPPQPWVEQVGNALVVRYPPHQQPAWTKGQEGGRGESVRTGAEDASWMSPPVRNESYQLPPLSMFALPEPAKGGFNLRSAQEKARKLETTLESFGVQVKVLEISRGPAVTRFEVQPAVGVKVSRILSLQDDIALALAARDIRIEAPVPGKSVIGIEVPNAEVAVVTLREVLESPEFQQEPSLLAVALGRDITGAAIVGNLQKMPHLLVAGATGSGKSVCINGIIASILTRAKPHEVKFLMIDPKMVELSVYNGIPHLLAPVVTDPRKAAFALKKVVQEMESRYQAMAERGARDIERFNQLVRQDGGDPLPYIVVIIDELADLMMVAPGEVEDAICRIAQMARAAGIHLIVATQRPSVDVITGLIKANIPSRIAFMVSSMADSRTILDAGGAEKLLGRGDMLYLPGGASKPTRVQGVFVSEAEIERLVAFVKAQQHAVYTVDLQHGGEDDGSADTGDLDPLFVEAMDLVLDQGQASVSMLQRRFRIGYARAARIIDQLEQHGLIGRFEGSKPREVRIDKAQWEQIKSTFRVHGNG